MRLQLRILLLLIPLVCGPLAFLGVIEYSNLRDEAGRRADAEVSGLMSSVTSLVSARRMSVQATLRLFSGAPLLREFIEGSEFERSNIYQRPLVRLFSTYQAAYPEYQQIALLNQDGTVLAGVFDTPVSETMRNGFPKNDEDIASFFVMPASGKPSMLLVSRVPGNEQNSYLAVLLDLSFLKTLLGMSSTDLGLVFNVTDASGHPWFSNSEVESRPLPAAAVDADGDTMMIDGVDSKVISRHLFGQLRLVAVVPESSLNAHARDLAWRVTQIIAVMMLLTCALVYGSLRQMIMRRLQVLFDAVTRIASGRLDSPVAFEGSDEIGKLGENIEEMRINLLESQARLNEYNRTLEEKVRERTQELVDTQQQLVLKEKVASVGVLTAGIAHEINNPVNFIHAGTQNVQAGLTTFQQFVFDLLADDADDEVREQFRLRFDALEEQLKLVLEGSGRIRDIVQNLRVITHLDQTAQGAVDVIAGLEKTVDVLRAQHDPDIRVECDVSCPLTVNGFGAELNQLFINLLTNAYQAMEKRHKASVDAPSGRIHISVRKESDKTLITIGDNGCGMSRDVLSRAFDPFFTTRDVGSGTGLGLSIAQAIMHKHDGEIRIDSEPDVGTAVTLVFTGAV